MSRPTPGYTAVEVAGRDAPVIQRRGDPGFSGRRGSGVHLGRAPIRLVGLIVLAGGLWLGVSNYRHEIVERVPASYDVLRFLGFDDVKAPAGHGLSFQGEVRAFREVVDGTPTLLVRGTIKNDTARAIAVPRLRVTVTGANAPPVSWTHDFEGATVAPGRTLAFSARYLPAPPFRGGAKVETKFIER